ncbi:MAG TPA: hypothetical protein EYP90_07890, partial [Chromatiaceae bacterium]|nr:hypothetical protein [Chromatiaceae bacterium]
MKSVELKPVGKIIVLLAALSLVGCAVGPDFKPPVVSTPESYRLDIMPVESGINLKWWELFNDPVLYTLVTTSLENNKDLKIAASRIEQARAFVGFNRADQFPHIDIEGGADTGNFFGSRSPSTTTNYFI